MNKSDVIVGRKRIRVRLEEKDSVLTLTLRIGHLTGMYIDDMPVVDHLAEKVFTGSEEITPELVKAWLWSEDIHGSGVNEALHLLEVQRTTAPEEIGNTFAYVAS